MSQDGVIEMPTETNQTTSYISPETLAEAVERRTRSLPQQQTRVQQLAEHDKRQRFRRLVDPGILRPNSKEQALASMKTLRTICENLIREPDNPKFKQFKPTNSIIRRDLVERKGALEYAIELGFRPEVENFQPLYKFNPRRLEDLKIGCAILKEALDLEAEKQARVEAGRKVEKAVAQAAAEKVKLAFMDDRISKLEHDQREKQIREGRLAALAAANEKQVAATAQPDGDEDDDGDDTTNAMPGSGHVLGVQTAEASDDEDPQ